MKKPVEEKPPVRRSGRAKIRRLEPNEVAEYGWDPETDCQTFKGIKPNCTTTEKKTSTGLKNRENGNGNEKKPAGKQFPPEDDNDVPLPSLALSRTTFKAPRGFSGSKVPVSKRPATRSQTQRQAGLPVGFYAELTRHGTVKKTISKPKHVILRAESEVTLPNVERTVKRVSSKKVLAELDRFPVATDQGQNRTEKAVGALESGKAATPGKITTSSHEVRKRPAPYEVQRQFIAQRLDARKRPGTPTPSSDYYQGISRRKKRPQESVSPLVLDPTPVPSPVVLVVAPKKPARSRGKSSLKSDGAWTEEERISDVAPKKKNKAKRQAEREATEKQRKLPPAVSSLATHRVKSPIVKKVSSVATAASPLKSRTSAPSVAIMEHRNDHKSASPELGSMLPDEVDVPRDGGAVMADIVLPSGLVDVRAPTAESETSPSDEESRDDDADISFAANQLDPNQIFNERGQPALVDDRVRYSKLLELNQPKTESGYIEMLAPCRKGERVNGIDKCLTLFVSQGTIIVHMSEPHQGIELSTGGIVHIGPGRRYDIEALGEKKVKLFFHRMWINQSA